MFRNLAPVFLTLTLLAADKKPAPIEDSNDILYITAEAHVSRQDVTAALGRDPGLDMVVVDVQIRPKGDNEVRLWLDDFTLISRRDGQKSQPLAPTQIAGKGALVVSSTSGGASGIGSPMNNRGPIWGGAPGTGGRPRRIGGDDDVSSATPSEASATMTNAKEENPLLAVLKEKVLPEKTIQDSVKGQLYFILDGKHKLKDLELMYKSGGGRLILDFIK